VTDLTSELRLWNCMCV